MTTRRPGLLALVLLAAFALPSRAGAHALLRQADPEGGTTLDRPPQTVTLSFTEDPEPSLSSIRVLNATGEQVSQGAAQPVPGRPASLRVGVRPLSTGVYTVTWRTVSRIDGHVTGGAFAFGVGVAPSAATVPTVQSPPPSALGAVARWMLYAGLSLLIGAAWVWTLVCPQAVGPWRIVWIAWAAAALGIIGVAEAQRADAGVAFGVFMKTSLGVVAAWRAVPLVCAAVALGVGGAWGGRRRRIALRVAGGCALAAIFAHIDGGHAAAAAGPWRLVNLAVQWLHFSAVGAWIGGLAALLIVVGRVPDGDRAMAVRRFSTVAGVLLAVVAATGTARAIDEVGAWERLVATPFGRFVLLKSGLLVLLAILGALNRYRSVPAAIRNLRGLRRIGTTEVAVAAVVFVVTALLTQTAPAIFGEGTPMAATRLVAQGNDFGTSVRAKLEVVPGFAGSNRFVATLQDYDTGRPVTAGRVSLRFTSEDRPDLGPSTLDLAPRGDGTYERQGSNLSLEGKWRVVAVVERGVNSVEVPLALTVGSPPQRVRTIESPGQPTLYSVDLPGGLVLDAYLDPGRAGLNEVHATYIDAAGRELPIPRLATMTVSRPGTPSTALPVRRFGPGHFIGDATLGPGEWQLDIVATTTKGEVLRTRLTVRL